MIIVAEWIVNSTKIERQTHINLEEPCIERGGNSTVHRGVLAQYLCTDFPSKIDLCHACHNDKCSNPKHLYWGTRAENIEDSRSNGTFKSAYESTILKYGKEAVHNNLKTRNMSKAGKGNKGKTKSEEHRRKISETLKARGAHGRTRTDTPEGTRF
jgi:hypothetical protein